MAKKSMLQRELKRKKLVQKYSQTRKKLLLNFQNALTFEEKIQISKKIQRLPKNSSRFRLRNRCWKTGKPRGYFRFFGLSRNVLREMAHECILPGLTKSSW